MNQILVSPYSGSSCRTNGTENMQKGTILGRFEEFTIKVDQTTQLKECRNHNLSIAKSTNRFKSNCILHRFRYCTFV